MTKQRTFQVTTCTDKLSILANQDVFLYRIACILHKKLSV